MRGYERDEYEDWDEYEEEGDEQEEGEGGEDEYEVTHQPTQEELEYLSLREKLKETIRKEMKNDLGTANSGSVNKTNASHKDKFGSFFGPSQPVIAQRVIQESRSLLENPDLAARIAKSTHNNNKKSVSAPVRLKSQAHHNKPSVTNGLKNKAEMLKNTRDYSFLLSEDAEVPASAKSPPPRNVSAPKSDARSAILPRGQPVVNDHGRERPGGHDVRKPMLASSHGKPKAGLEKMAHIGKSSVESRIQLGSKNGSGPGRPLGPKSVPSRSSMHPSGKVTQPIAKNIMSGDRKSTSSYNQSVARKPAPSNLQSRTNRPTPSHGQSSHLKRPLAQKEYQETSRHKVNNKQPLVSSRDQLKRSPPRVPSRAPLRGERPKAIPPKRHLHDEDSDANAINIIRNMFSYNPGKFQDEDDDSDMEANFDDIQREEIRSARIARKEDEEQLRLIEEEERRERMRQAKKRKLGR